MKAEGKITKAEGLLLGLAALFLCGLLVLGPAGPPGGAVGAADSGTGAFCSGGGSHAGDGLNTATSEQLEALPGIGEELAGRIVEYRTEHGGFSSVEELLEVPGIGEGKLAALEGLVIVEETTAQ